MRDNYPVRDVRLEHAELQNIATTIEKSLELASTNVFADRMKGLADLRALNHELAGIVGHCHAGDRLVETSYRHLLRSRERERIDAEHQKIIQLVANFREELKCAMGDRTMALILPGMDLVRCLRAHIADERDVLDRIAAIGTSPLKVAKTKKAVQKTHVRQPKHRGKGGTPAKASHFTPYTLEPHLEL